MPYINGKCNPKPAKPNLSFDNSVNPEDFPAPYARVNKVNSLGTKWKTAWDASKVTANQILNNLREDIFLYEVYGFYNLYYANNSFIRNTTSDIKRLALKVDVTTNKTYPGPSMNYAAS